MRIKAAICYSADQTLSVEEVELDSPQAGEVLVRIVATSVCHTDVAAARILKAIHPVVLGHEGAGIIESLGPGVSGLKPGDHVILTGAASCGKCSTCRRGIPSVCEIFQPLFFSGFLPGGQRRLHNQKGAPLSHFFLQSSFAEYAVVPQECAIKVREDAPLDIIGMLGCGVMTGIGAVINRAEVRPGETVAVFGCGGVGISSILGARLAGASRIIAIDINDQKLARARDFGATDLINSQNLKPSDAINDLLKHGVDCAVAASSADSVIPQAIESLGVGGRCIFIAWPARAVKVEASLILSHRSILGCSMGSGCSALEIPFYVDLFMQGRLPIDLMVTRRYALEEINDAFHDLLQGDILKGVIMLR